MRYDCIFYNTQAELRQRLVEETEAHVVVLILLLLLLLLLGGGGVTASGSSLGGGGNGEGLGVLEVLLDLFMSANALKDASRF